MMMVKGGKVYEPVVDFWIPSNRCGYLNYLLNQFPQDRERLLTKSSAQLKAIYIKVRMERG